LGGCVIVWFIKVTDRSMCKEPRERSGRDDIGSAKLVEVA